MYPDTYAYLPLPHPSNRPLVVFIHSLSSNRLKDRSRIALYWQRLRTFGSKAKGKFPIPPLSFLCRLSHHRPLSFRAFFADAYHPQRRSHATQTQSINVCAPELLNAYVRAASFGVFPYSGVLQYRCCVSKSKCSSVWLPWTRRRTVSAVFLFVSEQINKTRNHWANCIILRGSFKLFPARGELNLW